MTNEAVLRRVKSDKTILNKIVKRQMKLFGHVMGKGELAFRVSSGFVVGKRAQRELTNLFQQEKTIELIHLTKDMFRECCPNILLNLIDMTLNDDEYDVVTI